MTTVPKINPHLEGEDARLLNIAHITGEARRQYYLSAASEYRNEIEMDLRSQGIVFGKTVLKFLDRKRGAGVITEIKFEPPGRFNPVFIITHTSLVDGCFVVGKFRSEYSVQNLARCQIIGEVK